MRRVIAGAALVVLALLLIFGVRGCLNQRAENALEDYATQSAELSSEINRPSPTRLSALPIHIVDAPLPHSTTSLG